MIINLTKKNILAENPWTALSFSVRARGMIGRTFDSFDAMIFPRCPAVHTFFMSMPIDIVFLSRENRIMALYHDVKPWKPCIRCTGAFQTVELPAGTLQRTGAECNDLLDLNGELTTGASSHRFNDLLQETTQYTNGQTAESAPMGEQKS